MKTLKKICGISLLVMILVIAAPRVSFAQDYITEQDFYDALAPYGTWVYDNNYGDVWLPDVDETFRPYQTAGYWIMTEYGNTWVSDYAWGWATFHYGRWRFDDYYGWEWIPGYEWAPAWVSWRSGAGYYGWAPLSPDIDFNMSFGSGDYNAYWAFAPAAYIYSPSIYNYYVPRSRTVGIINRTRVINNTYVYNGRSYIAGPRASDVERYTHKRPTVYQVTNASRPGGIAVGSRSVSIFRPRVSQSQNARPQLVVDAKAYQDRNPNVRIARGGGSLSFSRDNAEKLAAQARSANPNSGIVHVNGQQGQQSQQPGQFQRRPQQNNTTAPVQRGNVAQPARGNVNTTQPVQQNQVNPQQNYNNSGQQRTPYRGRPENRPNVAPPRTQDNNAVQQQQAVQQQNDQQQRRIQLDQQRQAQQQQAQQQQAAQQRRAQFDQQRQAQQQAAQQAQQRQAQQQAQQADQQRRAQFEQQRQAQQQAAQQAQQQQAEQQRRAQAEQQRQQQAAQQEAQRQAQQQAAQQAQQQQAEQQRRAQAEQQRQQQAAQQEAQRQAQQQAAQQAAQRQAQQQAAQQAAQQRQQQQQDQQQQRRRPPAGN